MALTPVAFAALAGFVSETRKVNVMPATYVPLPFRKVKPVICKFAWALMFTFRLEPEAAFTPRFEISSKPDAVALIETAWVTVPGAIVTKKSMVVVPLTVLDADALADKPDAPLKFNVTTTVLAFAMLTWFVNATRKMNVEVAM
jgi:hypothetical protein